MAPPKNVTGTQIASISTTSAMLMVGREGVEPSTSRLSGVRSNHLSYRPPSPRWPCGRGRREPAQAALPKMRSVSRMKGHEDGGMFFGQEEKSVSYFCRHDP